jgi:hypothetical protein
VPTAFPLDPADIAPCSGRRVSVLFTAYRRAQAWSVSQGTSWKTPDGDWDGDCTVIADGLSEAEARALAAQLNTEDGRKRYVRDGLAASVERAA